MQFKKKICFLVSRFEVCLNFILGLFIKHFHGPPCSGYGVSFRFYLVQGDFILSLFEERFEVGR